VVIILTPIYLNYSDEPNAEEQCHKLLQKSLLKSSKKHIQTLHALSSLYLILQQKQNALEYANDSLAIWYQVLQSGNYQSEDLPPFQVRLDFSKILIELGKYDVALDILEVSKIYLLTFAELGKGRR
jgi:hypothetical protein